MTLIITLLTEATIYQSADHRLTNSDTGDLLSDAASKRVTLQYGDWDGLVSYTGVGRWDGRDTSDFVVEWLTGLSDAEPADVARVLQEEGARWIAAIKARTKLLRPHTFVLAFFLRGVPGVAFASNFEECSGRMRDAESSFIVSMSSFRGRPHVFVAGQKPAVPRASRRRLERLASRLEDEPQRIRKRLALMNREASESPVARQTVSPDCSVTSVRVDGRGTTEGQISDRVMARGFPTPDKKELERLLGRPLGKLVGTSFASSKPTAPFAPCQPRIAVPDGEAAYLLHEVAPRDLVHCRAVDVNDMNAVLGHGNHPDALGGKDAVPWTWTTGDEPRRCGFIGTPRHINSHGEVVGAATVYDGSVHAVRWGPAGLVDLGEKRELHSCATAITDSGLAAGWVSVDVPAKGQLGHRPAAWIDGELVVLRDFGCDWGRRWMPMMPGRSWS